MIDRYTVISADGHAGADLLDYKPYLAKKYHDEFDAWAASFVNPFGDISVEMGANRSWSSERRQQEIEPQGIAAEVIYPNTIPPFFESLGFVARPPTAENYERRWAGLQAHNRWMLDYCNTLPGRRAGSLQVFANNIDDAVAEVRWAKENFDPFAGVLFPSIPPGSDIPQLWSEHFEPLWQVCEELDVPINIHSGNGTLDYGPGMMERVMIQLEFPWLSRRPMSHMIFGGVFERHPGLKLVLVEQGIGWVPQVLAFYDSIYQNFQAQGLVATFSGSALQDLTLSPSEYLKRNVWFGAAFLRESEAYVCREIGIDRIMWGADYPHTEGVYPYALEALRVGFSGFSPEEVDTMLFSNPAALYGFDGPALRKVGDEIGPRVEDVSRHLDASDYPSDTMSKAFERQPTLYV